MKTKFQYICLLIPAFLLFGLTASAQQDPEYSQYMFNGLALNPAYAGSRGTMSGTLLLRKQWVQIEGAPATGSFSLHAPTKNNRNAFGINFVHDRLGITRQNFVSLSYAYKISVGAGVLSLGLRGGVTDFRSNYTDIVTTNPDQVNPGVNLKALLPRVGTGLYFSTERFYFGLSAPNILAGRYYRYGNPVAVSLAAAQKVHYFATTGVVIPLSDKVDFRPSVVMKYVADAPVEFDLNAAVLFNEAIWLGVGYRTGDAMIFMIELWRPPGFRIGYAYDLTLTELGQVNTGSHELMIGFDLGLRKSKIITPRYF